MHSKNADTKAETESRTKIGYWVSLAYIGLLLSYIIYNWSKLSCIPPNELGDFTAGAFGPLAILWLVLGYFQQGDELKQNTTALKDQADRLAESVLQQEQLVAISREQFEEAKREARREAARLAAAARPKFESQIFDMTEDSDGPVLRVKLTNVGAPCSHFRAISVSPGVHAVVDHPDDGKQTRLVRVSLPEQNRPGTVEFLVSTSTQPVGQARKRSPSA